MVSTIVGFVARKTRKTQTISGRPGGCLISRALSSGKEPEWAVPVGRFLTDPALGMDRL